MITPTLFKTISRLTADERKALPEAIALTEEAMASLKPSERRRLLHELMELQNGERQLLIEKVGALLGDA